MTTVKVLEKLNTLNEERADIVIIPSFVLGETNLQAELAGNTEKISALVQSSIKNKNIITAGMTAVIESRRYFSAVIIDKGTILGISDMVHTDDKFQAGKALRLYRTSKGNIGIILDRDIYYPEVARAMLKGGADFLICIMQDARGKLPILASTHSATFNGLTCFVVSDTIFYGIDEMGNDILTSEQDDKAMRIQLFKNEKYINSLRADVVNKIYIENSD